jgi:hypoxanthine phosphoribosyltransferase
MDTVIVNHKTFRKSITETEIQERIQTIANQISADLKNKCPLFVAVLNGAFVFASDLLRKLSFPCEITFVKMASYSGTVSTGHVKEIVGLNVDIENRTVVIIEDIIDSGLTMKEMLQLLEKKHPADIKIAALLKKPGNMKVDLNIDYCCFEIPNDFIVGYGLDFDGYGRNLPAIYTISE